VTDATSEDAQQDWGCYRHPYEAAGVRCTRCDRPICPKCMVTAPVGFQCPECVKGAPPVRRYSEMRRPSTQQVLVTFAIIAVNALLFLPTLSGGGTTGRGTDDLTRNLALYAPFVRDGEWYRLITSGFLHYGLLHIGFNMFILYQLGLILEPTFGRVRFGLLYLASLLGGSVGALLLSPNALTAGASGAVFGCMAAVVVALRRRGVGILQSNIGGLLVINLVLTFLVPGISVGGHLGGLAAGALGGLILDHTRESPPLGAVAVAVLALALFGAGIAVA
jgi:membrane associated rhomboid family serine protease